MATWAECTAAVLLVQLAACTSPAPVQPGDAEAGRRLLADGGRVHTLQLEGLVELHWTDEDGDHVEQGDLELWLQGDDHISARVTKFGDVYLWTGITPETAFTFDLAGSPTTLLLHGEREGAAAVVPVAALRRLLGLGGLSESALTESAPGEVVLTDVSPENGSTRITLDAAGSRIQTVTWTSPQGAVFEAAHRGHDKGVHVGGMALGRYVDVRYDDMMARLVFVEGQADEPLPGAVFNVERLTQALRPELVERGGN